MAHTWQYRKSLRCDRMLIFMVWVLASSSHAWGQSVVSPPGRLLASNCLQCHGTSAAAPGFKKLTGKSAAKLFKEVKKFQSGGEGENIMAFHARGFSDEQLHALTQWLSTQP